MNKKLKNIILDFKGKVLGNTHTKTIVADTLSRLPKNMVIYITENCWIVSSINDAWAYTFKGSDIPDKYLIFLSDELLSDSIEQIRYTLLHEIGHIILNHNNSINYRQTKREINKQEKEADEFAKKYLTID
jgi:Zn-dependent peptidase ImmA (M78 family)